LATNFANNPVIQQMGMTAQTQHQLAMKAEDEAWNSTSSYVLIHIII